MESCSTAPWLTPMSEIMDSTSSLWPCNRRSRLDMHNNINALKHPEKSTKGKQLPLWMLTSNCGLKSIRVTFIKCTVKHTRPLQGNHPGHFKWFHFISIHSTQTHHTCKVSSGTFHRSSSWSLTCAPPPSPTEHRSVGSPGTSSVSVSNNTYHIRVVRLIHFFKSRFRFLHQTISNLEAVKIFYRKPFYH